MKIFCNPANVFPCRFRGSIATIGIFDGVHSGHRTILNQVVQRAKQLGKKSLVITFDPHPAVVLTPEEAPPLIMSFQHRLKVLEKIGFDVCWMIHFTKKVAHQEAWRFVRELLVEKLGISEVWIGNGFRFGRGNLGNVELLKLLGQCYGFSVHEIDLVYLEKQRVSSTKIRQLVEKGKLKSAERLLGHPVSILGRVISGKRLGKKIGFPTANLNAHHEAIPPSGVYVVWGIVNEKRFQGVVNIGVCPTVNKRKNKKTMPTIEVHLMDFKGNLYGKNLELCFVKKLRNEKQFPSLSSLANQIQKDIQSANLHL